MNFLVIQCILIGFNLVNVFIDAYKIKILNKEIRHGINFSAYAAIVALCYFLFLPNIYLLALSAFTNRQTTFDIPLNLKRGLEWDHVSTANPPKAIMDRIEKYIFGSKTGAQVSIIYAAIWIASTVIQIFL